MTKDKNSLIIFLFVSISFHVVLLYILPTFNLDFNKKLDKIVKVKFIKAAPTKIKSVKKKVIEKKVSASDLVNKILNDSSDKSKKTKPDVKLPEFTSKEKINLDKKSNNLKVSSYNPNQSKLDVSSEIKNTDVASNGNEVSKTKQVAGNEFFQIESSSNRIRRPIVIPKMPEYSLENDTEVKIQFLVDAKGYPSKITFLSATDTYIEKLSTDFVSGLRFESADSETQVDKAIITLFFKVR